MAAVRTGGLEVPRDISIVGLHDIPQAAYLNPPLTTVRMPLAELGSRSVDLLLSMIAGTAAGEDMMVATPPELIVRGSCRPLLDNGAWHRYSGVRARPVSASKK